MKVIIIKYNAGNAQSVLFALNRIGIDAKISDDLESIKNADKLIFPGVGQAKSAMQHLKKQGLDQIIPNLKQPVLGICLGMQLLCANSEEGNTECLNVFKDVSVKAFVDPTKQHKIPKIGWNGITLSNDPLFENITEGSFMYFVHGFFVPLNPYSISKSTYIQEYSVALKRDNFYGVQFHPEKSGSVGQQLLKNFLSL